MARKKEVIESLDAAQATIDALSAELEAQREANATLRRLLDAPKPKGSAPSGITDSLAYVAEFIDGAINDSADDTARQWTLITIRKGIKQLT